MTVQSDPEPPRMTSAQAWVAYLSKVELPVLANTLRRINELTQSSNSTVSELANVILNDAQLTSQVLRLSNTVFYNQTRTQVGTVSRAITLIGFDAVKAMAISSLLVDTLLQRSDRPHLLKCLARALHAAVQARCLLPKRSTQALEEVFIGALLMNIGELAFWSCDTEQASELEHRLRQGGATLEAQKTVLHCTFTEITRGLVEAWSLGPFIRDVVAPGQARSPATRLVRHSVELARLSEQGWRGPEMDHLLDKLAEDTGQAPGTLRDQLKVNADEAAKMAVSMGIAEVTDLLPGAGDRAMEEPLSPTPVRDPALQLAILQELTRTMTEKPDINEVCQLVTEGIHRAVGMERVALLMSDPTGQNLVPRRIAGRATDAWKEAFVIPRDGTGDLGALLPSGTPSLYQPSARASGIAADPWLGRVPALTGALVANGRLVGMFYADNADSKAVPSDGQLSAFSHFLQNAQLCLTILSKR
ncbi:HDOD domain-containing protein [Marinobacter sp. SS21]|uniref:HDOD domain-containing protein n=1 Tax=Marinobacter sp. SS21 TaxID=2979460 RepID=UPI00232EE767|nr:HDOD domain-containing protein [Marinobacter sp. SS21]MDC0661143.1 HDOD domain-containing protein [Marinobacter sp. SS21]